MKSIAILHNLIWKIKGEWRRSRMTLHRELILSFCLSASHPCSWTRSHRADVHFNKHPHDLFQVLCGVCFQWFVPERSPSYPCSWARHRRNGVRFLKRPQNVSRSFRRSSPTFHFWSRCLTSYRLSIILVALSPIIWIINTKIRMATVATKMISTLFRV